jgi:hypothetical protein
MARAAGLLIFFTGIRPMFLHRLGRRGRTAYGRIGPIGAATPRTFGRLRHLVQGAHRSRMRVGPGRPRARPCLWVTRAAMSQVPQ